jgi:hypothetical protein
MVQDHNSNYYVIGGGTKRPVPNQTIANQWDNNGGIAVPVATNGFLDELPTITPMGPSIKTSDNPAVYVVVNDQKDHIIHSTVYQQSYSPFAIVSNQLVDALPTGSDM